MKKKILLLGSLILTLSSYTQIELSHSWHQTVNGTYDFPDNSKIMIDDEYLYAYGYAANPSVDFDPSPGMDMQACFGSFISKYDLAGNYIYTIVLSGVTLNDLAFDHNHNIFVCGTFDATTDFDPSAATVSPITPDGGFMAQYLPNGQYQGHIEYEIAGRTIAFKQIAFDVNNNAYVAGSFDGTYDFDFTGGVASHTGPNMFVLKASISSGQFEWVKILGGPSSAFHLITGLEINQQQQLIITGSYQGSAHLDPNGIAPAFTAQNQDLFVCKWDTSGNFLNGILVSKDNYTLPEGNILYLDGSDNIYIAGNFNIDSVDMDPSASTFMIHRILTSKGTFVASYDNNLNFRWAKSLTSINPKAMVESNNTLFITGYIENAIYEETTSGNNLLHTYPLSGTPYPYLLYIDKDNGNISNTYGLFSPFSSLGFGLSKDSIGDIYLYGSYADSINIDPMHSGLYIPSAGLITSTFMVKYQLIDHTGISETPATITFNVYPNPTTQMLLCQSSEMMDKIIVMDQLGKILIQKVNILSNFYSIDVSFIPNGTYFIETHSGTRVNIQKFIKQ